MPKPRAAEHHRRCSGDKPSRSRPDAYVEGRSAFATVVWLGASGLFSWYAANFGNFNKTYGSLGAVVVLLMWFYVSAYIVLAGAELNSAIEKARRR